MIRIQLVDLEYDAHGKVRSVLEAADDIAIIADDSATESSNAACEEAADPDIVLMPLKSPKVDRGHGRRPARSSQGVVPRIVLVADTATIDIGRLLRAGAFGYIAVESAPTELIRAIRAVHAGRHYICQALTRAFSRFGSEDDPQTRLTRLTEREQLIFRFLAAGMTTRQIAADLGLSRKTVNTHRSHVLSKLALRSNAEVVRFAAERTLQS